MYSELNYLHIKALGSFLNVCIFSESIGKFDVFLFFCSNTCPLVATDQGYFCNYQAKDDMSSKHTYEIKLCNASFCKVLQSNFKPKSNSKCEIIVL